MEKRPKLGAVYFKQVSDDIWMYHDGSRSGCAAAPVSLGADEFDAFNETLASIGKSLVLAGPLATRALHLVSAGGQKASVNARGVAAPTEGRVETFNRDAGGEWFREINVSFDFSAKEGQLKTEYCLGRSSMRLSEHALLFASAHLSGPLESAYEGEENMCYELKTGEEMALLETIAKIARLPIVGAAPEVE